MSPLHLLAALPIVALMIAPDQQFVPEIPISRSPFHLVYPDVPMVQRARKGEVSAEVLGFLRLPGEPLDRRLAVANALIMSAFTPVGGHEANRAELFAKHGLHTALAAVKHDALAPEDALFLAYFLAADAFQVATPAAAALAEKARKKRPASLLVAMIAALVRAQSAIHTQPCKVWPPVMTALYDPGLRSDLRPSALDHILDSLLIYRENCPRAR